MNRKNTIPAAIMSVLLGTTACTQAPKQPKVLMVDVDLSASAPPASDRPFAGRAANEVGKMIDGLSLGDTVVLTPIGESGFNSAQRLTFRLTPQMRQNAVAARVGAIIASTPDSDLAGQQETAITFAVENSGLRCNGEDRLVLITDGMESRRGFDRMEDVIEGKAELPKPPAGILKGCKVTMLGMGIAAKDRPQLTTEELRNLKAAWRGYFRAAGIADADIDIRTIF